MLLQFTLDTNQRKDVELAHNTIGYVLGFTPVTADQVAPPPKPPEPATDALAVKATPVAPQPVAPAAVEPAKPKRGKKADVAPVEGAAPAITLEHLRNRLTDYSADSRFGMNGVLAILGKYGVQRISDLRLDRYSEFDKEISDALTTKADPLA